MITLYQFHWSHYVEKVRWALDYKELDYRTVEVDPFTKHQMQNLPSKLQLDSGRELHTVPTLEDDATGTVIGDSSRIIEYLEQTYPTPALYPADAGARERVARWMRWLDSTLGLAARRLAYTQIIAEQPGILGPLFVPQIAGASSAGSLTARLAGTLIGGVLSRRFRFRHNRADGAFAELEECLLVAARRLSSRSFLEGERFTAADLTLAALSRPALLVPWFRDHPHLQALWAWRATQLQTHRREPLAGYEKALHEVRQRRGWERGAVRGLDENPRSEPRLSGDIPNLPAARNDQQPVSRWPLIAGPVECLRLKLTCGLGRTPYRQPAREPAVDVSDRGSAPTY